MKRTGFISTFLLVLGSSLAMAAPLATAARRRYSERSAADYLRRLSHFKASPTALALKDRVLPPNLKEFESAVEALGWMPTRI